jgi:putative peptide zinc metalloprotease protein
MPTAPVAASDLERRKKLRIRLRQDLEIAPQKYEGRTYYVVKDPVSMRYYRFKEQENFLIDMMDGTHTLDEAQKEYEKRFRPERLTLEDLEGFAQQLLTAGLAQNESPQAGKQLFDRRKKRKRSEWMQTLTNILYIKIPLIDPDKILDWMLPYTRWMFTSWFLAVSVAFMMAAILHVATHFGTFYDKLPSYHEFFSFKTVVYLWFALGVVKVIHEFGHGLSCKAFGGEVHEMGALFLVFSPCLYCNVSDAWTLPDKWKRIIISAAGIYVELIIAAIATFVWWNTPAHPFINNLALSLMVVCSVSTVVFNANPLMRYDGYYVLADLLEIPNLRDRSNRFLQRLAMDYCLGIEVQPEQYMALWRRILFVVYAIVSYIYRWVITFSILYFMSNWLKPYKLGVVSGMLACAAAGSMIGWPLYRMLKNWHKRGRLPDMKSGRVTLTSMAVAAFLLCFFLVPLPVSRVRQVGLVQVQTGYEQKAVVDIPGILEVLKVRDGEHVQKDQVLAVLRNLDMENQMLETRTQRDIFERQYNALLAMASQGSLTQDERAQLDPKIAEAKGERDKYANLYEVWNNQAKILELKAPRDGIVMSPPKIDEIGKYFEKGQPLCSIGDPRHLKVVVPLEPHEYRLLERDLREDWRHGGDLEVVIRVHGRANRAWHGKLTKEQLPESEAKEVPIQLTNKAGGNIAVKPARSSDRNAPQNVPQSQEYLIGVDILDADQAIAPGTLASVKVSCHWRTAAWYVWQKFSSAFDLGMDLQDFVPGFMRGW